MSDRPVDLSRRRLCQAACAAGGLVALSAVPGCGGEDVTMAACTTGSPGVGPASLAVGEARYVPSLSILVCRDEGGYYALGSDCPHLGAKVAPDAQGGFTCPLHASTFDFNGKVLTGPAMEDLPHYSLCTTESGLLLVDVARRVTADTRLVV